MSSIDKILGAVMVIFIMLLVTYPALELTRLIIIRVPYRPDLGITFGAELALIWGGYLAMPPVLLYFFKKLRSF